MAQPLVAEDAPERDAAGAGPCLSVLLVAMLRETVATKHRSSDLTRSKRRGQRMTTVADRSVIVWQEQITTHVKVAGHGPPVVFLHGAAGLAWDAFLETLAEHHTVYAPEHPGTTVGDPHSINYLDNLWDLVLYYYEVFDRLGLTSVPIIGHSFGGMVAAELAANNPERVGKLALISPIGLWRDDTPVQNWMILTPATDLPKYLFYDPDGPVARQVLGHPEDPDRMVEAQIQFIWAMACTGKFVWPIPDKGLKKRIHRITAPTLILWGKEDRLVPPAYAQEFARRIPAARVELVGQAGHMPQLEQHAKVSELILGFLHG
jgi:pimeloyl-ACP methyl ester carboxylesterase